VGLYGDGEVPIEEFLGSRSNGAKLVEKVVIETGDAKGAYSSVRKSHTDFAVLNAAAVRRNGSWRVAVGARPGSAQLSAEAAKQIGSGKTPSEENATKAGEAAASELSFGSDLRGSADYRKQICSVLVKRAIMEVAE
jgi:CO/xanthine dehydrogenase FAD-binding subunit